MSCVCACVLLHFIFSYIVHSLSFSCTMTGDNTVIVTCMYVCMCVHVFVDHQFAHGEWLAFLSLWPRGHRSYQTYIHPCRSLPELRDTAWQLGYGVHTNLHPQVCTLYWGKKVKYWLHSTEQTSEEVSVVTDSQCGCCGAPQACRATGYCISSCQRDKEASPALWIAAIIFTTFRMPWLAWPYQKITKYAYQHLQSSLTKKLYRV